MTKVFHVTPEFWRGCFGYRLWCFCSLCSARGRDRAKGTKKVAFLDAWCFSYYRKSVNAGSWTSVSQVGLSPGQLFPRKMRLLLAAGSMGMLRPANDILAENDFSKDRYRGLQSLAKRVATCCDIRVAPCPQPTNRKFIASFDVWNRK